MGAEESTLQRIANPDEVQLNVKSYLPIEAFLSNIHDLDFICWLMDQIGVLRSVFELFKPKPDSRTSIVFQDTEYYIDTTDRFSIKSEKIIAIERYQKDSVYHLADGNLILHKNDKLYYLTFEECPDWVFEQMLKYDEQKFIRRSAKKVEEAEPTQETRTETKRIYSKKAEESKKIDKGLRRRNTSVQAE